MDIHKIIMGGVVSHLGYFQLFPKCFVFFTDFSSRFTRRQFGGFTRRQFGGFTRRQFGGFTRRQFVMEDVATIRIELESTGRS